MTFDANRTPIEHPHRRRPKGDKTAYYATHHFLNALTASVKEDFTCFIQRSNRASDGIFVHFMMSKWYGKNVDGSTYAAVCGRTQSHLRPHLQICVCREPETFSLVHGRTPHIRWRGSDGCNIDTLENQIQCHQQGTPLAHQGRPTLPHAHERRHFSLLERYVATRLGENGCAQGYPGWRGRLAVPRMGTAGRKRTSRRRFQWLGPPLNATHPRRQQRHLGGLRSRSPTRRPLQICHRDRRGRTPVEGRPFRVPCRNLPRNGF